MPLSDLARVLMDSPRWVETRFMLLRGEARVTGLSGDRRRFVAASTRWPLIAVVGRPDHAFIADAALGASEAITVLCAEEDASYTAQALDGWRSIGAEVFAWPGDRPLPVHGDAPDARLLDPATATTLDLPATLQSELATARDYSPLAATFVDGRPAAFCYATSITESLWDVSIDTLEGYRRRGLAAQAFRLLAAIFAGQGKRPAWGALDDNEPSRSLARKLGFVPAERLTLFSRVPPR